MNIKVDEYLQTLRRSSLPTVITEGKDDYLVFRRLEDKFSDIGLSLMPVGGRTTVLSLFNRRNEFSNISSAFIMDKDIWLFSGVPEEYSDPCVIFTEGYSIENDLYRDGELESILRPDEKVRFARDILELSKWFSFAVKNNLDGGDAKIDIHPTRVLDENGNIRPEFAAGVGFREYPQELCASIQENYAKMMRGKTLLALLIGYLSHRNRDTKHSRTSLMETASVRNGAYMGRFYAELGGIFRAA